MLTEGGESKEPKSSQYKYNEIVIKYFKDNFRLLPQQQEMLDTRHAKLCRAVGVLVFLTSSCLYHIAVINNWRRGWKLFPYSMSFKNFLSFFFHFKLWFSLHSLFFILEESFCKSFNIIYSIFIIMQNLVCILVGWEIITEEDVRGGRLRKIGKMRRRMRSACRIRTWQ